MTLDISAVTPRVQYTVGNTPDSTFDYSFPIFEDADISVYVGSTKKTLTTHYTVSGAGTTSGGTVTMTTGNAVSNATVTLVRNITIARTTDFPASGAFQVDSLNTELDRITAVQQELEDDIGRSLRLADEDATATLTIPLKDARKGRYLAFNTTTGNAEAGPTQTDATAIASVTSDIALLADIQDGTTATNAITTLANIHGNVTTVADIHGNVTTIATGTTGGNSNLTNLNTIATGTTGGNANLTQINAVASDLTDINAVAGKATEIGRLGTTDAVADMALLGDSAIITDMGMLAVQDVIDDMAQLADSTIITNMANLNASGVITNINNLNASGVITNIANLNASGVLTNIANLNASGVLTNIANLNATDVIANIGTVATNVNGVNSFADRYRVASSAPTGSLDVGDLYFDTTANELKVYKSSGWSAAGSTVNGTSARFHYNISGTPNSVTGADANGNTLAYDAGFADVYVNGVRMSPDDITITSGTSVVFSSNLADGDDVDIVAFGTFNVANIVSTGALNTGSITSGFGNIDTGSSTITTTGAISGGTLTGTLQTASQTNITGVGALDTGSITSGFGAIDNGSSAITTTGAISGGTVTSSGDLTVGGIDLFVDTSADKVGIGTATANQLHKKHTIYSSAEAGIQFQNNNTGVTNSTDGCRISVFEDDIQYTNYESAGKQIFNVGGGSVKAMEIDSAGHVTMPSQSAFSVQANQQNNLTINASTTIEFANEIFDQNADFDHTNYTFQAPVTGKYMLNVNVRMDNVQYAHTYMYMTLYTSNRVYESIIDLDRANSENNNWDYVFLPINILADMDASDTAYVTMTIPNAGSSSSDVVGSQKTTFSGYLAC